jgi:hypothetical protein
MYTVKKSGTIVIFFIASSLLTFGQGNYVQLENGERIAGEKIRVRGSLISGTATVEIDDIKKFSVNSVDHYVRDGVQFKKGFKVGNTTPMFFLLAERGQKINLYYYNVYMNEPMYTRPSRVYFYSQSDSSMTKMKVKTLSNDLKDNAAAMMALQKARQISNVRSVFYVAATGLLTAGVVSLINSETTGSTVHNKLFIAGAICLAIPIPLYKTRGRHMKNAIDLYNR